MLHNYITWYANSPSVILQFNYVQVLFIEKLCFAVQFEVFQKFQYLIYHAFWILTEIGNLHKFAMSREKKIHTKDLQLKWSVLIYSLACCQGICFWWWLMCGVNAFLVESEFVRIEYATDVGTWKSLDDQSSLDIINIPPLRYNLFLLLLLWNWKSS